MDDAFVRNRISQLRSKLGISEYRMSQDLGHSKSYIQSISSGRSLPSLTELFYICDYLGVTPKEFFDTEPLDVQAVSALTKIARQLSTDDLNLLIATAERLCSK